MNFTDIFKKVNATPNGIEISASLKNDICVIVLNGLIDTYNSSDFIKAFSEIVKNEKISSFVLDMENIHYVSSTGIGSIVNCLKQTQKENKKLYILKIQKKVDEVFKLLGFKSMFVFIDNIKEIHKSKDSIFPTTIQCSKCGTKLKIIKPGRFKCSNCHIEIKIDRMEI